MNAFRACCWDIALTPISCLCKSKWCFFLLAGKGRKLQGEEVPQSSEWQPPDLSSMGDMMQDTLTAQLGIWNSSRILCMQKQKSALQHQAKKLLQGLF